MLLFGCFGVSRILLYVKIPFPSLLLIRFGIPFFGWTICGGMVKRVLRDSCDCDEVRATIETLTKSKWIVGT